jgi:hypothetical protein
VGLIKTVNEAVRERMNECVEILARQFMSSVRPIYGSTEHEKPYHIGSCVLIEIDKNKYLVTAAHVIDHNKINTLYVSGESDLVQLEAEALITNPDTGNRDDDKLDFAILSLSDEITAKLGNVVFINESGMLDVAPENKGKLYLALGFPNSKNKKANNKESKVTENPFVYSSTLNFDEDVFNEVGATTSQHYLLDFCSKHSKDENNNKVNSIAPKGASGGALFFIEGMNNPDNYRPDAECIGKLTGILIENHKPQKVIMATKISVVKNALTTSSSGRAKGARR